MKILRLLFTVAIFVNVSFAQDKCQSIGWANCDGQTYVGPPTGGSNATVTQVTTFAQLKAAAESSDPKVIHVMNDVGNGYKGTSGDVLNVKANKTIVGVKPGITVKCSWQIGAANIIVRNLICRGPGNSNSEQNWDCVNISGNAKRIWFDHCTIMEGEDGNFDVVKGADNVTATWCKFTYVTGGDHNLSNLIGSSDDEPISHGKLNVTFAYCWWDNVNSRTPRSRYGKIHVLNSYYSKCGGTRAGFMANQRIEGCYFDNISSPIDLISPGGKAGIFVLDCYFVGSSGASKSEGGYTVFTPPYAFDKLAAKDVKSIVTDPDCGAGPTMNNPTTCGCGTAPKDCNGVTGGTAVLDACNICVGGNTGKTACVKDCNGVANGTASLDNCSRCIAGNTGKVACASLAEMETEACDFDGVIETKNTGFKGASYINVDNAVGTSITFNVLAGNAGTANISFRYANGGTADRPAQISLNGTVLPINLSFPVTTDFLTWKTAEVSLVLLKGNNVVKLLSATAEGMANIDQIGYVSAGLSKGSCTITGIEGSSVTSGFQIFPNPFSTQFTIQQTGDFNYQILSLDGKEMVSGRGVDITTIGELLPNGTYLLKIQNQQSQKTTMIHKFVN